MNKSYSTVPTFLKWVIGAAILGLIVWCIAGCDTKTFVKLVTPEVEDIVDQCLTRECCEEQCEGAKWHPVRLTCECDEDE